MIPTFKLARLPRSQKLRKAEKILAAAELRLVRAGTPGTAAADAATETVAMLPLGELSYLAELLGLLAADVEFSPPEQEALENARAVCGAAAQAAAGDAEALRRALNNSRHVLLAATGRYPADWDLINAEGRLDSARRRAFPGMLVYLEDIRSPFNVGAMFRSAESFGAEKLLLSPLCADPRHPRALRTAMGCVDVLPWERGNLDTAAGPFFALETGGVDIADFVFPKTGTLIAGSEELGVSPAALALADASLGRVSIGTYGAKGSLNVSVAFGIAMQRWAAALASSK